MPVFGAAHAWAHDGGLSACARPSPDAGDKQRTKGASKFAYDVYGYCNMFTHTGVDFNDVSALRDPFYTITIIAAPRPCHGHGVEMTMTRESPEIRYI